ncbi:MAG: rod shape-determining protein MreD [Elusimicrobia bacterium RIFOXYB2_FULL_49_7]|nr:MAG: rod shape-determining protein MreD [Elusimicrobia bacterium RIFOXYB2_FULL_49_7]
MQSIVLSVFLYLVGIVIQFSWSQYFSYAGIAPNVIISFIMFLGLVRGSMTGLLFGFAWGISWDVLSIDLFGSHALLFTSMGYFAGMLNRKWNESKVVNQMLVTLVASLFFWLGMYSLFHVFGTDDTGFAVNYSTFIQPFYNMLIAPAIFFIGKKILSVFAIRHREY